MIVATTPSQIEAFSLLSILGRLRLEIKGIKLRGRSTFAIVKQRYGFKGNHEKVLAQYKAMLIERRILFDDKE